MISDLGLGWSGTWKWLGVSNLGLLLIGWAFYRDNPEECGLQIDGKKQLEQEKEEQQGSAEEYHATTAEALRTRAFWIPNLSLALWGLALTGLTFHIVDIGKKAALSEKETLNLFLFITTAINLMLDSNYFWICGKPETASLLDIMGPWPWYILTGELVALLHFFIAYAPFWYRRKRLKAL